MKKCDIIIPIYNAYECVRECIDSVIKYTDLNQNGLILIDDKSPDERMEELLSEYKKKHPNIEVLYNKVNKGFVGTVNVGMKHSKNDVLLLNSDTEVTKDWLEKIKECAYSKSKVATVTPLSNNATLASVPNSFVPNDIPEGYTLDEMAALVENCSNNEYPEVPTGHGFCLFIKREVLEDVGYFDVESYGRGYGEENDFCFRCLNKGYRHLLCDNTYIFHKESQSFAEDKKELIEEGLKVLKEKYPKYMDRLELWCGTNRIKHIGENVAFHLGIKDNRPNILYVIHDFKDIKNNHGGTSLHAYDLIRNLRDKYNFHVLTPEDGIYKLYSYWEKTESAATFPQISEFHELNYYNSEYKIMLENIIDTYGISLIHIHHLKGHYFDIKDVIKEKKVYSIITLHDYYSSCPQINKIYKNEEYCSKTNPQKCNECLKFLLGSAIDITSWKKEWSDLLNSVNKIIAPSNSAAQEIKKAYSDIDILAIEHGIDLKREKAVILKDKKNYNVAFIGAIGIHKGSRTLESLMNYNKLGKIKIHLFGIVDSPNQRNTKYFQNHGKYKREDLPKLLKENNIDLICLFSTWPETYSYTLTEAVACGIPVLSYNFGAIAERIEKHNLGWTIDSKNTYKEICEKMHSIFANQTKYNQIVKSINKYKIKTVDEMGKEYKILYKKGAELKELDVDKIKDNIKTNSQNNSNISYSNYAWVFDTLKWKIISKVKVPKSIKRIMKRLRSS